MVLMGTAAVLTYQNWPRASDARVLSDALVPSAMNVLSAQDSLFAVRERESLVLPKAEPAITLPTLGARYRALAKMSDPASKFAAYRIAEECRWDYVLRTPGTPHCEDLPLGEVIQDAAAQLALLTPGVQAGEWEAWWRLRDRERGVFGTLPDSPGYRALEEQGRRAAFNTADPLFLTWRSSGLVAEAETLAAQGKVEEADYRRGKALAYEVAARESRFLGIPGSVPLNINELPDWAKTLPADIKSKAVAEGKGFAAAAYNRRKS
jgi:hypothetical protein